MSSIVTITFSPCIDKSLSIPSLIPEKELRCTVPKLEPGVGGINVVNSLGGALLQAADEGVYFLKTNLGGDGRN